jgi:mRNA interferase MazF
MIQPMPPDPQPRRGEIWTAWLDPIAEREQGGRRPVLVVSSDFFNALPHNLCIVVPLTRTNRHIPTHVEIPTTESGLSADSIILCDQIRSISTQRLRKHLGIANEHIMAQVTTILHRIIPEVIDPSQ